MIEVTRSAIGDRAGLNLNGLSDYIFGLLVSISGAPFVSRMSSENRKYGSDETLDLFFPFDVLIKPNSVSEVSAIMKLCTAYQIPVTPRGGGSGVTGGALPVRRGIVLSLERLNRIIEIDTTKGIAIVESGVITEEFCRAVEEKGMYYPVKPSSASISFVGGNVSENAGSINSCKYGVTGDYILNLEVVLPDGEILWTGKNVKKDVAGVNLTQLFVGSEGTLGIITKVVYRLIKKPSREVSLLMAFDSLANACQMVLALKSGDITPSAVELLCEESVKLCEGHFGVSLTPNADAKTYLVVQLEGWSQDEIMNGLEWISSIASSMVSQEILIALSTSEKERLWKFRLGLGQALTANRRKYRDIDATVPVDKVFEYLAEINRAGELSGVQIIRFGHVMDGNIHAMVLLDKEKTDDEIKSLTHSIYDYAIQLGGTLSGEHGIGWLQKDLMNLQFNTRHMGILQKLKHVFDPCGILNPQKIF